MGLGPFRRFRDGGAESCACQGDVCFHPPQLRVWSNLAARRQVDCSCSVFRVVGLAYLFVLGTLGSGFRSCPLWGSETDLCCSVASLRRVTTLSCDCLSLTSHDSPPTGPRFVQDTHCPGPCHMLFLFDKKQSCPTTSPEGEALNSIHEAVCRQAPAASGVPVGSTSRLQGTLLGFALGPQ